MPPGTVTACIALGSNLGDRAASIEGAIRALATLPSTRLIACSTLHETAPVGGPPQGAFLNAAAAIETALAARELLDHLLRIERERGRDRSAAGRWGPRTLDLDLLLYGDRIIEEPGLTVPHPLMHQRRFVLAPLAEVSPGAVVPGFGLTIRDMLALLDSHAATGAGPIHP